MQNKNSPGIEQVLFICNPEQVSTFPELVTPIFNKEQLHSKLLNKKGIKDQHFGIIILLELKWNNRYHTDFPGLNIIYHLRAKLDCGFPIILTSHYPEITQEGLKRHKDFRKNGYQYLKDPSISFTPFPLLKQLSYKKILSTFKPPLNDPLLLKDLKENLYIESGFLISFFNNLSTEVIKTIDKQQKGDLLKDFFLNKVHSIQEVFEHKNILDQTINKINQRFADNESYSKTEVLPFIRALQQIENANNPLILNEKLPGKIQILYVEDQNQKYGALASKLKDYDIQCTVVNNSDQAIKYLKDNPVNVICCDFRFYNKHKQFSREQGYHIIQRITKESPGYYIFIILTNHDSQLIPQFFPGIGIPVIVRKDTLIGHSISISKFAQLIILKNAFIENEMKKLPVFGKAIHLYHNMKLNYKPGE